MKRLLVSIAAIFLAWMFIDTLSHRLLLHSLYESSPNIWRPLSEMNPVLIIVVTCVLILIFIATYRYLVKPKSLANGFVMGGLLGVALGTSSGFGTYIHSPISLTLAISWLILGTIKGLVAGGILGLLIRENR